METIVAHPQTESQLSAIKKFFSELNIPLEQYQAVKSPYNADFVAKIKRSEEDLKQGRYTTIEPSDIWNLG
jgi:hypothetical protein